MSANHYRAIANDEWMDDERVANLITTITSTSFIPTMPSLKHIFHAQTSIFKVPALAKCRKIIVFDGVPPTHESKRDDYEAYRQAVVQLTHDNPFFLQTQLIICKEWVHLSGALKKAVEHVTTPFLFIHQHDDILTKPFDLNGCVVSMLKNPHLKHIHLTRYANKGRHAGGMQNSWDGPVDTVVEGGSDVPLTRCFGWSDYSYVTRAEYLKDFVLPKCGHGFPETFIHRIFKDALRGKTDSEIAKTHLAFGTFLYGGLSDGNYIHHSDGSRDFGGDASAAPHDECSASLVQPQPKCRT